MAGPGSGKTTALGVLARAWTVQAERVGLAPMGRRPPSFASDPAANLLDKLLFTLKTGSGPAWLSAIGERTLVLLDEAGAVGTPDLDRLIAYVTGRGASIRLLLDSGREAPGGDPLEHPPHGS
jgi:hypothetical protein